MKAISIRTLALIAAIFFFSHCESEQEKQHAGQNNDLEVHQKQIAEQFVMANQQLQLKENDEMDAYVRSHNMPFVKTSSGIRYYVYSPSARGDSIRSGTRLTMHYKLYLLDGTLCYSSDKDGVKNFEIGNENIESGIHKGLQYLKRGDKAFLILPSALAHGLLGDMNKIPPQMPIVYDVEVY